MVPGTTATTATPDHRSSPRPLGLFPPGTALAPDGALRIGGCHVAELAERYGTPALIVDEGALRDRARRYADGLAARRTNSAVAFASKAFPCTAVYRLLVEEGLGIDVASGGELALALAAGTDPAKLIVHGNAKTDDYLRAAVEAGAGLVVIDNFDDIERLEHILGDAHGREQAVLVRVTPDVRPDTHEAVSTGQRGSKFGLLLPQAREAIARLRGSSRLRLDGLHVHIGSQILDTEPFVRAVEAVAELGEFPVYDLGGGLGARYTYDDRPPSVEEYLDALASAADDLLPSGARVIIEPGRSMVAEAGVSLYRVVTVKRTGGETFVAVDGGMGDNLEVSLYGQRFEATVATRPGGPDGEMCRVVGQHCESGDVLSASVPLNDPRPGDLIAVPVTGAYTYSLANNYNAARRPPVVFCRDGRSRPVVRRETYADLMRRDLP
ncbi:diaminopimelate decarboxylase [Streptomyces gilvosporeus]|uniref:Diaminopimelate decarboxylase n=1 Tax=Streptomyces gilvosporeus TaxID=553510 RepID=A0A1V0TK19_9ACTN|nr:diaminopimelate decarboxylase [Streptomyces gilvosporeus]ARF53220.1 diaminopimelate decarboxylase [Streptomyces gilvosporeus]